MANHPASNLAAMAEPDLGYGQLFGVLIRRRLWLISGILLGMTLGGIAGYRAKPTYTSSLQMLVEPNYRSKKIDAGKEQFSDVQVEVDIGTQNELLKSTKLVQQAMRALQPQFSEMDPANPRAIVNFKKALQVGQVAVAKRKKPPPRFSKFPTSPKIRAKPRLSSRRCRKSIRNITLTNNAIASPKVLPSSTSNSPKPSIKSNKPKVA
jgi:uncharacterized protein involved in exopolysaccharide biosynthesis